MKYLIYLLYFIAGIFLGLAIMQQAHASQLIKIAIIDTGYSPEYAKQLKAPPIKLCLNESKDYVNSDFSRNPYHGTEIASIIAKELINVNYCAIIYKVFSDNLPQIDINIVKALKDLETKDVVAINLSFGGTGPKEAEKAELQKLNDKGILIFAADGNDNKDLDKECNYYPVCYYLSSIVRVAAADKDGYKCEVSNYGKDSIYVLGTNFKQESYSCATSYATPRALSEFVSLFADLLAGTAVQTHRHKQ